MAEKPSAAPVQKVVFDTDVLIWYLRANDKARRFMELVPYQQRALSSLTFMELLQDETTSRRAIALLEEHAFPHGLRVVDALIAATALETGSSLATANVKHYRPVARLHLIEFKP